MHEGSLPVLTGACIEEEWLQDLCRAEGKGRAPRRAQQELCHRENGALVRIKQRTLTPLKLQDDRSRGGRWSIDLGLGSASCSARQAVTAVPQTCKYKRSGRAHGVTIADRQKNTSANRPEGVIRTQPIALLFPSSGGLGLVLSSKKARTTQPGSRRALLSSGYASIV